MFIISPEIKQKLELIDCLDYSDSMSIFDWFSSKGLELFIEVYMPSNPTNKRIYYEGLIRDTRTTDYNYRLRGGGCCNTRQEAFEQVVDDAIKLLQS